MLLSPLLYTQPPLLNWLPRATHALRWGGVFGGVQVNKNYASGLHVDKNNLGPSYIVGVGDYTDGSLFVQDLGMRKAFLPSCSEAHTIPYHTIPYRAALSAALSAHTAGSGHHSALCSLEPKP